MNPDWTQQGQPASQHAGWLFIRRAAFLLAFLTSLPSFAAGEKDFAAGIEAYRAGRTEEALGHFQAAVRAGVATSAIKFDIALCYYRLRRYADAEAYFRQLTKDKEFQAAAEYQLGLIAYQQGNTERALQHLNSAESLDARFKERSGMARARITGRPEAPITSWYFRGVGGYDNNVTLVPDEPSLGLTPETDSFIEAEASIDHRRHAYLFSATAYSRSYRELSDSDQIALGLFAGRNFLANRWNFTLAGAASLIRFGGERFQELAGPRLIGIRRGQGPWQQRVRLSLDRVSAPEPLYYLEGWRSRLELTAIASKFLTTYEFEYNHREEESVGQEFFSHSPMRHKVLASFRPNWIASIETELFGEFRYSDYLEDDRFLEGTTLVSKRRQESLATVGVKTRFPRVIGLRPVAIIYAASNRSTVEALEYSKIELTVGFEYF